MNRYWKNQTERFILAGLFLLENTILCVPLSITCSYMTTFYEQLSLETRLLPEETTALTTCRFLFLNSLQNLVVFTLKICRILVWLPLIVGAMTALTIPLPYLYYNKGHPWKILVQAFGEKVLKFSKLQNNFRY